MAKASAHTQIRIKNKKAEYAYFLIETYTAGIQLMGSEIKSIRLGRANLADAYCSFIGNELFVKNMHIADYPQAHHFAHEPKRDRKLLLTRRELKKLMVKVQERGLTIIPVLLYINETGLAKLDIALARGKHYYDKRETLKQKDTQREMERDREH
ncbi:MAG TPA: SsrA-binding protein SmpB [Bacteroidales bacterium]|nr:SsrA-binding protein SmpB [Bacteroidales bacterium]